MKYSRVGGLIEIYFNDLNDDAKKVFLEAMGLKSPEEGNYDMDIVAIAEIPIPSEDENPKEDE